MIFLSLILDGIFSRYYYSLFTPLTLIFYYKNKNRYIYTLLIGFIYDILYTDTLFLNAFIFLVLLFLIEFIFKKIKYNLLNVIITSIIIIITYRISIFLILLTIGYIDFNIYKLIYGILYSLINIIFVIIYYLIKS